MLNPHSPIPLYHQLADIIAVQGDPLQNLAVLEQVSFVMLGGREISTQ